VLSEAPERTLRTLADITRAILGKLDPDASRAGMYQWYDPPPAGESPG